MDTTLLRVFQEVARRGSFTGAAEGLGYTQSAVSRQVAALEGELGEALFDRLPRGARLTEAGRFLLPHAEAVTERLGTALGDLRALRELAAGRLRVGTFPTADAGIVPYAVAAFREAHPRVALTLVEGTVREQAERLRAGDLDVAVVAESGAAVYEGLELRRLWDDRMYVALPPSHRLAGRRRLRLAELADEDWVAGSARPEETLLKPAAEAGFRPRLTYVIGEWIAKLGYVAAGLGVTLVPSLAVGAVRADVALVELDTEGCPARRVHTATPRGIASPPALAAFLGSLGEAVARLDAELTSRRRRSTARSR